MLDVLKNEIQVSDKIKLYLTSGKEILVEIVEISETNILVKNEDGTQSRFFENLIGGWNLVNRSQSIHTSTVSDETTVDNHTTSNLTVEAEPTETLETKPRIGLKILGKIDLEKVDPKRKRQVTRSTDAVNTRQVGLPDAQSLSHHIRQHNLKYKSFQNLQDFKDKIISEIGQQIVPANAFIKIFYDRPKYGFVTDRDGKDYFFHLNDVRDERMRLELLSPPLPPTQIVCHLSTAYGKTKATSVYFPKTIDTFFGLAQNYYNKRDFAEADTVLSFILGAANDHEPALRLKEAISKASSARKVTTASASALYLQGKLEIRKGNVENGKKILFDLIRTPNIKSENALKELAYELQREGKLDDAIETIVVHQHLIKTSDPNSLLAYFYEIKKDYATAITFLNKVRPKTPIERIKLEKRLAIAYFQTEDYSKSEEYLRKLLTRAPADILIRKQLELLERVKSEGLSDEVESIFDQAELSSLTSGRSPHIQFALDNCNYTGVPTSVVSEENFTKATLQALRRLIEDAGKARPKERALYLLSEAKLMETIEPAKEDELSSVLSRYCLAMSQNLSAENNPVDVIRFYLLEGFRLAKTYDAIARVVPIYLFSFRLSSFESSQKISQALDTTLKEIFDGELNPTFWYGMIDLFLTNTDIFSQLLTRLYQDDSHQKFCVSFLTGYLSINDTSAKSKDWFSNLWNKAVDKRRRERESFNSNFLSLSKTNSTEAFLEAFKSVKSEIPAWVGNLDRHRINLTDDILRTLMEFNTQSAFEDKERYFNIVGSQITVLLADLEATPTEFSFNVLRKLLTLLNKLVEREFKTVIQTSKPVIGIKILGESIIHDNNEVIVSLNVSNKKGSAPISGFTVALTNNDVIQLLSGDNESNQSLKGGDDKTLKLKIKVSDSIREQGAFNLKIEFSFKVRGSDDLISFPENLAVRLYSEKEFDEILNPFAAIADSGPVQDEKMFYGRNEFIDTIKKSVLESSSKCIIIYGQKRSGKSSVLFHLKKQLNVSKRAFCISFSLGEIVDDLSSQTFYYKILSEIEDSLESYPESSTPKFVAPTLSELKEAPSLVFNDYMKRFRKECLVTSGWEDINLILLIDEFTYIYTAIQKGFLSDQFMKTWKSFVEKSFFTSILIGQDIMPKFKMAYQNEFGIAEDKRLSYLSKEDAIKLIEQPIWDAKRKRSRYIGKALDLILDYTSSNPYYIQIFCARLVEYMNRQKAISVTEADVYDVAQTFIKGEQSLSADKFDNLITAGDADVEAFDPQDIYRALKEIAFASKNLDSCSRVSIKLGDHEKEEQILSDLKTREVISCPQPTFYKIKVRLFKEWLLNN